MAIVDISEGCHFTLQNIPFGIFSIGDSLTPAVGTAIGDYAVQLAGLVEAFLPVLAGNGALLESLKKDCLNDFMALGRPVWRSLRLGLIEFFSHTAMTPEIGRFFHPLNGVKMHIPCRIGDYTDFYASREHASNVGEMFRGRENALMPNWLHLPVGYHGRASSVIVSGQSVKRPHGQIKPSPDGAPILSATRKLDFELEMAFVVGVGNELGHSISIDKAEEHIFGVCLLNDWSARDIQAWEYVPLGPFLGKSFATTLSPWIVTLDALEPFRCPAVAQEDPRPLEYLQSKNPNAAYNVELEVKINNSTVCKSNLSHLYWNFAQQLAHHTVNGCNMRPGDLCGTGTISGPERRSFGSMLELSWNGRDTVSIGDGQERKWLEDGDTVWMSGFCSNGQVSLGFGECSGQIIGVDG